MRQTTRRKYWGRSAVAQALMSARGSLEKAAALAGTETPLKVALKEANKDLARALQAGKVYQLEHKRLMGKIEREMKAISELISQAQGTPVTGDEKIAKKITKAKLKGGEKHAEGKGK